MISIERSKSWKVCYCENHFFEAQILDDYLFCALMKVKMVQGQCLNRNSKMVRIQLSSSVRYFLLLKEIMLSLRTSSLQFYGQSRVSEWTWKVNHSKSKLIMPLWSGYKDQSCQTRGCYDGVSFCRSLYLRPSIFGVLRIQWQTLCRGKVKMKWPVWSMIDQIIAVFWYGVTVCKHMIWYGIFVALLVYVCSSSWLILFYFQFVS